MSVTTDIKEFYSQINKNTESESESESESVLCIDYGTKKIGLAIANSQVKISMPLTIIVEKKLDAQITSLENIITKHKVSSIVIGLPLNRDGTESDMTEKTYKFANKIDEKYKLPILLKDERYSSSMANNILKSYGMKRKHRNRIDDKVAASIILEGVLYEIERLK